ncbi:MAG: hypothetical protein ABIO96_10825 [Nitrospiraceae bacterium]
MDAMNHHMHSRRAAKGLTLVRGAVVVGLWVSALLTALPSVTFADGRDGDRRDDKGRHSLVQQPYGQHPYNARSPFGAQQATVQATIDALTTKVDQLIVDNMLLKEAMTAAQGKMETMQGTVDAMKVSVEALDKKTADIISLGKYIKVDTTPISGLNGPHILITGANVHVRSGSGSTDNSAAPFTGLGNLIIGYNENTTPTPTLVRTGSHNLVGGGMNSFNSVGGLVFGFQNTISGSYASILGGSVNTAAGPKSTVYGGASQTAANLNSYAPIQGARPAPGQ